MNFVVLVVNFGDICCGGFIIFDFVEFIVKNFKKVGYIEDLCNDGMLEFYQVVEFNFIGLVVVVVEFFNFGCKNFECVKNMFVFGLLIWLYGCFFGFLEKFLVSKFVFKLDIWDVNFVVFKVGYVYGEMCELFWVCYEVVLVLMFEGIYCQVIGNFVIVYGFIMGVNWVGLQLFLGFYFIILVFDIFYELFKCKVYNVVIFQVEDEIVGVSFVIGVFFFGLLGVIMMLGFGMSFKFEVIGLVVMMELLLVVVDVQCVGFFIGMLIKFEQVDLLQVMFGCNGEFFVLVFVVKFLLDCFDIVLEVCCIVVIYCIFVIMFFDGYFGNGVELWKVFDLVEILCIDFYFVIELNIIVVDGLLWFMFYCCDL